MAGTDKTSAGASVSKAEKSAKKTGGLFSSASQLNRLFVVLAGAFINLLFGVLIFAFLYTWAGAVPVNLPRPRVDEVISNSPAQKAGLGDGDIILSVNGENIDFDHPLANLVARHTSGEEITLKVHSKGAEKEVNVKLEEYKE